MKRKLRPSIKTRQKLEYKMIIIFSTCGAAVLLMLTTILNFSYVHRVKAKDFEIIQAEEQIFTTEMSLPAPQINYRKNAGPNTIFIKKRKQLPDSSAR